jgi:hypothetical protein
MQAIYGKMVLKGPLLHSPVPQPYAHLGNALMVLPEDVRFSIKLEWGKLDGLLAEALVSSRMLAYAHVCSYLLTYAHVC